jgi:hypothetical protein
MFGTKFLSWITIKGIFYSLKVNNKLIFHFAKYILPTTSTSTFQFRYENRKNKEHKHEDVFFTKAINPKWIQKLDYKEEICSSSSNIPPTCTIT